MDAAAVANLAQGQVQQIKNPADGVQSREAAKKASQEFESVFISQMMEMMFEGIKTDGPFGGGHAEGLFRSLMIKEYGQQVARSGGIGLADSVYQEILKMQEIK